jgi:hypothetical protein
MEGCRGMAGIKLREEESSNERRERQIFFFLSSFSLLPFLPPFQFGSCSYHFKFEHYSGRGPGC